VFAQWGVIHLETYLIGAFLIIILPGPNSLYVLSTSAARGVFAGYQAAFGVFAGDTILISLTAAGATSLLQKNPILFFFLKSAGAAYLFYIGAQMLYGLWQPKSEKPQTTHVLERQGFFQRALLLSLLNPKALLFLLSFFVQFVDPSKGHPWRAFLVLGGFLQLFSVIYLSILIFGGAKLAVTFRRFRRLNMTANLLVASVFIGFALRMLLDS